MKASRRMKRMGNSKKKVAGLSLVSLMDVFTILVFFLLTNSASDEVLRNPKEIALPESSVESKPRETLVIFISDQNILVKGEIAMETAEAIKTKQEILMPVREKLMASRDSFIGLTEEADKTKNEVTVLADKKIQFFLLKKIMSTATSAGFEKISLAVLQKGAKK